MNAIAVMKGDIIHALGRLFRVEAILGLDKIQVIDLIKQDYSIITPGDIEAKVDYALLEPKETPPTELEFLDPKEIELAEYRFNVLVKNLNDQGKIGSIENVLRVAKELGISRTQLYRILQDFEPEAGFIQLVRARRGRKYSTTMLSPQLESIIEAASAVYRGPGATYNAVVTQVQRMCESAGLTSPSASTISERLRRKKKRDIDLQHYGGRKAAQDNDVRGGKLLTERPLSIVQIDHCLVDVIIVDQKSRTPLTRPWLTMAIDVHTRVNLGMYLSLNHPSSMSVALCVSHAILPKNQWLHDLGITEYDYPFYGLMKQINIDNGIDFRASAFVMGCKSNGIKTKYRPPGGTHYGGHIERLNGTFMTAVRGLPGAIVNSVKERKKYTNLVSPAMTFNELRLWLLERINIYHKTEHSELGQTPLHMWESCFEDGSGLITLPEIITDKKRLLLDFLPFKRRKLNRRGISISGIVYYSPILKKFQQKQEFIIKYDPTSMKRVWARPINESTYFELTYADLRLPDVSLSEFKAAKKCTRDSSRGRTPVAEVFAAIERNERRELDAKKATKRERVDREKRLINSEEPLRKDILGSSEPLPKSQLSVNYDTPAQIFESDDE